MKRLCQLLSILYKKLFKNRNCKVENEPISFSFMTEKKPGYGEDADPIILTIEKAYAVGVFDGMGGAGSAICDSSYGEHSKAYVASRTVQSSLMEYLNNHLPTNDVSEEDMQECELAFIPYDLYSAVYMDKGLYQDADWIIPDEDETVWTAEDEEAYFNWVWTVMDQELYEKDPGPKRKKRCIRALAVMMAVLSPKRN